MERLRTIPATPLPPSGRASGFTLAQVALGGSFALLMIVIFGLL